MNKKTIFDKAKFIKNVFKDRVNHYNIKCKIAVSASDIILSVRDEYRAAVKSLNTLSTLKQDIDVDIASDRLATIYNALEQMKTLDADVQADINKFHEVKDKLNVPQLKIDRYTHSPVELGCLVKHIENYYSVHCAVLQSIVNNMNKATRDHVKARMKQLKSKEAEDAAIMEILTGKKK